MNTIQSLNSYSLTGTTVRILDTNLKGKRKPLLTLATDWYKQQHALFWERVILRNYLLLKLYRQFQKYLKMIQQALQNFQVAPIIATAETSDTTTLLQTLILKQLKQKLGTYYSDEQLRVSLVVPLLECINTPNPLAAKKVLAQLTILSKHILEQDTHKETIHG